MGVNVVRPETTDQVIHASGHPYRDELKRMYQWTQPDVVIPVHGETEHMDAQVDGDNPFLSVHHLKVFATTN